MAVAETRRRVEGIGPEVAEGLYVVEGAPKSGRQAIRNESTARRFMVPVDALPAERTRKVVFDGAGFLPQPEN